MHTITQAQQHAGHLLSTDVHPTDWHNLAAVGATIYALQNSKRPANQARWSWAAGREPGPDAV